MDFISLEHLFRKDKSRLVIDDLEHFERATVSCKYESFEDF